MIIPEYKGSARDWGRELGVHGWRCWAHDERIEAVYHQDWHVGLEESEYPAAERDYFAARTVVRRIYNTFTEAEQEIAVLNIPFQS